MLISRHMDGKRLKEILIIQSLTFPILKITDIQPQASKQQSGISCEGVYFLYSFQL